MGIEVADAMLPVTVSACEMLFDTAKPERRRTLAQRLRLNGRQSQYWKQHGGFDTHGHFSLEAPEAKMSEDASRKNGVRESSIVHESISESTEVCCCHGRDTNPLGPWCRTFGRTYRKNRKRQPGPAKGIRQLRGPF